MCQLQIAKLVIEPFGFVFEQDEKHGLTYYYGCKQYIEALCEIENKWHSTDIQQLGDEYGCQNNEQGNLTLQIVDKMLHIIIVLFSKGMEQQKSANSAQYQRSTSALDIRELREIALKQHKRNLDLYERLKDSDVFIDFPLCMPQNVLNRTLNLNCLEGEKKELMLLMDKLMLQSDRLDKLDRKNKFHQQRKPHVEDARTIVDRTYGFMRKAWTQDFYSDQTSDDKVDRLSKVVGSIKGNLQKTLTIHRRKEQNKKPLDDILLDIQAFTQLKEAYERLQMSRQEMSHTFYTKIKSFTEKLQLKEKQNDQLRQEIKEQKDRIRKLENQTILSEAKTQQLTERLNRITFQQEKNQKRVKLVYNGNDFELSIKSSKLVNLEKMVFVCDRKLQQIQQILNNKMQQTQLIHQKTSPQTQQISQYTGVSPTSRRLNERKSNSIKKMQSPCYREQISNVKFARTNSLIHNGINSKKPNDQTGIEAKFYTKMNIIEKLQNAFTK